jgi:hypothetical protein
MAPGIRRPRPILTVRHSFQPSRLRDQLLVTAYRLLNEVVHPDCRHDAGANRPADRRLAPGEYAASLSGENRHE